MHKPYEPLLTSLRRDPLPASLSIQPYHHFYDLHVSFRVQAAPDYYSYVEVSNESNPISIVRLELQEERQYFKLDYLVDYLPVAQRTPQKNLLWNSIALCAWPTHRGNIPLPLQDRITKRLCLTQIQIVIKADYSIQIIEDGGMDLDTFLCRTGTKGRKEGE